MIANITVDKPSTSPHWMAAPIPDIAKLLGVSERTVRYLVRSGELPTFQSGRGKLIRRADALDFLDRRFTTPKPRPATR